MRATVAKSAIGAGLGADMPRTVRWIVPVALCVLPMAVSFGQSPARPSKQHPLRHSAAKKPVTLPPLPSGPLPQVPMNELPAAAPQVTYQNGLLAIVAQNSSLGDILRDIHKLTGASIDVPPNATERVATRLGPGPARDVLADLLNGSSFNYVMLGSAAEPASLAKVVLTMKPAGGAAQGTTQTAYQPPPQQFVPQQPMVPNQGMSPVGPVAQAQGDEESDSDQDADDNADEDQDQDQAEGAATPADGSQQPNAGPKTPEQILDMLRQRQQQGQPGQPQQFPRVTPPQTQPPEQ